MHYFDADLRYRTWVRKTLPILPVPTREGLIRQESTLFKSNLENGFFKHKNHLDVTMHVPKACILKITHNHARVGELCIL